MSDGAVVIEAIQRYRLIPVVSETDPEKVSRLADALVAGGLPIVEITLRAAGAIDALHMVSSRGDITPLAGTVVSPEQVDAVVDTGAKMIVSPGYCPRVVERAQKRNALICPGVSTPSDIMLAQSAGLNLLKFFPAEAAGGVSMLKALSGPFPNVRFVPTGGITCDLLPAYFRLKSVIGCGGSWMVSPKLYADGSFHQVEQITREAMQTVAAEH